MSFTREAATRFARLEVDHVPNCTQLAENTAHHFDEDAVLDDPDHWIWEVALEVWEQVRGEIR